MGVSHATSGAAVGLVIAQVAPAAVGVHGAVQTLLFAVVVAGYATVPDLDHPSSLVTRRFSVVSWLACQIVRPLSELAFRLTATSHDDPRRHAHRGLTHTFAAALAVGFLAGVSVARWGNPAVWVVMFVGMAMAVKGLDALIPGPPSLGAAAVLTWLGTGTLPWQHVGSPAGPWLGFAVTAGMAVHGLGDSLTESGCPLFAPLRLRGRAWYRVRPPAGWRLHTGKTGESVVLTVLTVATLVLAMHAVPGLWTAVTGHHPVTAHVLGSG